jgi:hypothetical protein
MKQKIDRVLLVSAIFFMIASCTKGIAPQQEDIDEAVKATVIAQAVASTLTAQAPSSSSNPTQQDPTVPPITPTSTNTATPMATPTTEPTLTPESTSTPMPSPTITPSPVPHSIVQYDDFSFSLEGCIDSGGGKVNCDFVITNLTEDRELDIFCYASEMYDDLNNRYACDYVSLANDVSWGGGGQFIAGFTSPSQKSYDF